MLILDAVKTIVNFINSLATFFKSEPQMVIFEKTINGKTEIVQTPNAVMLSYMFGKKYLGAGTEIPTTRIDGTPVEVGDLFYDLNSYSLKLIKDFSDDGKPIWDNPISTETYSTYFFKGDGKNKEFNIPGGYNPGKAEVFVNGINKTPEVDISDGVSIKFDKAPNDGDEIFIVTFKLLTLANAFRTDEAISTPYDITILNKDQGLILKDRSKTDSNGEPVKWRLFIDDGNLGIEEVK